MRGPFHLMIVAAMLAAHGAEAAESVTGRVIQTGTFGSGRLFVQLDVQINEPGCVGSRFDVPGTHPQVKNWLAIALAASLSGKKVVVHTNGCYAGLPTMSENTDAWFYVDQ
jgi:hypothetical protein